MDHSRDRSHQFLQVCLNAIADQTYLICVQMVFRFILALYLQLLYALPCEIHIILIILVAFYAHHLPSCELTFFVLGVRLGWRIKLFRDHLLLKTRFMIDILAYLCVDSLSFYFLVNLLFLYFICHF